MDKEQTMKRKRVPDPHQRTVTGAAVHILWRILSIFLVICLFFGITGGVMEAALRTAYEVLTGKTLPRIDFEEVRGLDGIREATIPIPGVVDLKVAVVYGLKNARTVMEQIKAGTCPYHFVEVMACPGGCIDGAGQPYHHGDASIVRARHAAIYEADRKMPIRKSHENPEIIELYDKYLGKPGSHRAHELLHTTYIKRVVHKKF